MEYYITKVLYFSHVIITWLSILQDKDIAFRIFELGMKKFSNNIGFLLAYVDYLSHLNG